MAALLASDVTYAVTSKGVIGEGGYKQRFLSLTFGDGVKTYPSGGVPLDLNKLGLPAQVKSFNFTDMGNANGFIYKYDMTNNKLRIYQGDNANVAAAPLVEIATSVAPASAVLGVTVIGF